MIIFLVCCDVLDQSANYWRRSPSSVVWPTASTSSTHSTPIARPMGMAMCEIEMDRREGSSRTLASCNSSNAMQMQHCLRNQQLHVYISSWKLPWTSQGRPCFEVSSYPWTLAHVDLGVKLWLPHVSSFVCSLCDPKCVSCRSWGINAPEVNTACTTPRKCQCIKPSHYAHS